MPSYTSRAASAARISEQRTSPTVEATIYSPLRATYYFSLLLVLGGDLRRRMYLAGAG
ncbi:MAG: hypothetical protein QXW94_04365 [Desulfurococcaceae archaeon]